MTGPWMALVLSLTVLVVVLAVLVLGLMRRVVPLLESGDHGRRSPLLTGLSPGETVPPFELEEPDGTVVGLIEEPRVFLFLSGSCQPCQVVATDLRERWQDAASIPLVVVLSDEPRSREMGLPPALHAVFDRDGAASGAFRNSAVPRAYAVDRGGLVVSADGVGSVDDLVRLHAALAKGGDAALHQMSLPS